MTAIVAHPERNREVARDPGKLRAWADQGVLVQVNTGSLTGEFGPAVQVAAIALLRDGLVHCLGTDAPDLRQRPPLVAAAVERVVKEVGTRQALRPTWEFPAAICRGDSVPTGQSSEPQAQDVG